MDKAIKIILALILGISAMVFPAYAGEINVNDLENTEISETKSVRFTDVNEKDYYYFAVDWAVDNGVTTGTSEMSFSPEEVCLRCQIVTFLWRTAGCPEPSDTEVPFTDIKEGSFYYNAVLWAYQNGITTGTSKNTFSPYEPCLRGQIITMLWRWLEKPKTTESNITFSDVDQNMFCYDSVKWAAESKITTGTSENTFSPNAECSRSQAVTFIFRTKAYNFNAIYIRTTPRDIDSSNPGYVIIKSKEELENYYKENESAYYFNLSLGGSDSFEDSIKKYDEAWFENNMLIMVVALEPSGGIGHVVEALTKSAVYIKRLIPEVGTTDMDAWHIIIEADSCFVSNTDFSVKYKAIK